MPVRSLTDYRDMSLRTPCGPADPSDRRVESVIEDLWDTLLTKRGVAMAAPQIGVPLRLFVFDLKRPSRAGNPPGRGVLINPAISHREGSVSVVEGCLSFPDLDLPILRPERITVSGQNERGEPVVYSGTGLFARMIEHEMDHLDGILLPDRQTAWGRLTFVFRRFRWERGRKKGSP